MMDYFLGNEEMKKINESNLDEIKCVAQYEITKEDYYFNFTSPDITVENNTIVCQDVDSITKYLYSGTLPSQSMPNESLQSYKTDETSWKTRIHFDVVHKCTLLSIRDKSNNKNMLFDNGMEFLRINHVCDEVKEIKFYDKYLAIVTSTFIDARDRRSMKGKAEECWIHGFILINIIHKSNNEYRLVEVFQTIFNDLPFYHALLSTNSFVESLIFNSSKLLLVWKGYLRTFHLLTFNMKTLQFSSLLALNRSTYNIKAFCKVCYCYSNLLQDVIIFIDKGIVYIVKESMDNHLYIYKKISLPEWNMLENIFCCHNRNNEIILFIDAFTIELGEVGKIVALYDVLNGKTRQILFNYPDPFDPNSKIFFNRTGEEIFIVYKNQLDIYVYKSKVRTLKRTCQILVLEQYSSEQLSRMNLPKNILKIENN